MWVQALVRRSSKTHQRTVQNKVSRNRVKVTKVEIAELTKKKNNQSKSCQTLTY